MKKKILLVLSYFLPFIAFAQFTTGAGAGGAGGGGGQDIQGLLRILGEIFSIVIPILITLALIYFLWGVARYIMSQGDEEGQKVARGMMINGIIALFVIITVWGLVAVLNNTFVDPIAAPGTVPTGPPIP